MPCRARPIPRALPSGSDVIGTTDGGSQWNELENPAGGNALSGISCINPSTCTVVGSATIFLTADGGTSWTSQAVPAGVAALQGVSCASPANCEAVGTNSNFGGTIETLSAPPTVTTTALPTGTIGVPYAGTLQASGGLGPLLLGGHGRRAAARSDAGLERDPRWPSHDLRPVLSDVHCDGLEPLVECHGPRALRRTHCCPGVLGGGE